MRHTESTSSYATIGTIETDRLTIKDVDGRVNYFDNATVEIAYIMDDKFYKVSHSKGIDYYNPRNVVFLKF